VVPLRIAKSVVLLGTSALAKALDHVAAGGAGGRRLADVVSLSMGGVASRAWADAVNKCYEAGVVLVAAAGNNFSTGIFGCRRTSSSTRRASAASSPPAA
jgi:subtilisin family serine protease